MLLNRYFLPFLFVLLTFVSCSFNKEENNEAEKAIFPDLILENAKYIMGQEGENPISLEGTKITFYSKDDKAEIENISFNQEDNGEVSLEGRALFATVDTKEKILNLKGNVKLRKVSDNMEIEAEEVYFDSQSEVIKASGRVKVVSKDGSFVGLDFNGSLKDSYYTFSEIEEGKIN